MRIEPIETIPAAAVAMLAEAVSIVLFLGMIFVWLTIFETGGI